MAPHLGPLSDAEILDIVAAIDRPPANYKPRLKGGLPNDGHDFACPEALKNGSRYFTNDHVIPMHDQLAFTPRKLRVITVGAGFSGVDDGSQISTPLPGDAKQY